MRRLLIAVLAACALALTACGPPQGPAGTVVDKDREFKAAVKHWEYELTTRDKAGKAHEFEVSLSDYNDCVRGARYPKCIQD